MRAEAAIAAAMAVCGGLGDAYVLRFMAVGVPAWAVVGAGIVVTVGGFLGYCLVTAAGKTPPPVIDLAPDLSRGRYSISCYNGVHGRCGYRLESVDCHCRCHDAQEARGARPNS